MVNNKQSLQSTTAGRVSMLIGYARVSTAEQNLDLQIDALTRAGCSRIFADTASGAKVDRPELHKAFSACRANDTLVVWKLDRLGRSLQHLIETVASLSHRGVGFKTCCDGIDTTTSSGKLVFHIFAALAEFERSLIRDRTIAGLKAARDRGRSCGRPRAMTREKAVAARKLLRRGASQETAAKEIGVSPGTLSKFLRGIEYKPASSDTIASTPPSHKALASSASVPPSVPAARTRPSSLCRP